ncbi:related to SWR1-complex protein 3 [Zygosaccharomyces bailii]|nr:related to SWR1-complex protein 3 [Zygosaccharomyces bailii]
MPVVLRSRSRYEGDSERPQKTTKPVARRGRRSKSKEDENDESDSAISDGELGSSRKFSSNGRPFEIVSNLPCSLEVPQYNSALTHPLSVKDSAVLYDSLVSSRKTWVRGEMFELYFSKPTRTVKEESDQNKQDAAAQTTTMQIRDKMQKMCDCTMVGGPHHFPVRMFILKNEELERKWQLEQDSKKKEKEERRKRDQEEKKRRVEEKKKNQLQKKQEKEKLALLHKENKAKAKQEMEIMKLKRKEEIKKAKEEHKKYRKSSSVPRVVSTPLSARNSSPPPTSQSVNDPKMIANLNLMAQRDTKLNALMGIVANGEATLEQVEEFKKFIEIAKKMPPPPGWNAPQIPVQEEGKAHNEKVEKTTAEEIKEEQMDSAIKVVAKEDEKKEEKRASIKSEDTGNSVDPRIDSEKPVKRKRRPRGSAKNTEEDKSMQLTAFQQKYVQEAQMIIEFLEFTQARYMLPRNAIIEHLEDSETYKISWVMVHNKKEIDKFRNRRVKDLSKGKKTEEEKQRASQEYDVYDDEMCPTPLYTPMTIAFTGIHKRFNPIMLHSVEPLEKVQKEMSSILTIGTRLSGYNLWYQLDGYDDKNLAESIRVDLNEHEHELRGKRQKK